MITDWLLFLNWFYTHVEQPADHVSSTSLKATTEAARAKYLERM